MEADSFEVAGDFLEHFGVKGMKWGVVKQRYSEVRNGPRKTLTVKAKNGMDVTLTEKRNVALAAAIAAVSKTSHKNLMSQGNFSISVGGKKVGAASFDRRSKDELNLVWLGVKSKERGKGYGSAVFDASIEYAKSIGVKRITLEVPGESPDARHIYEKRGFVAGKTVEDDIWGGLTNMSLELSTLKHADVSPEDAEIELALEQTFPPLDGYFDNDSDDEEETPMAHQDDIDSFEAAGDFLEHFGVKGMKWGVRRGPRRTKVEIKSPPGKKLKTSGGTGQRASTDAKRVAIYQQKIKKSSIDALSDEQLRATIKRMELERQYNRLKPKPAYADAVRYLLGKAEKIGEDTIVSAADDYARKKVAEGLEKAAAAGR